MGQNNYLLILSLLFFTSCTSKVLFSSKHCGKKARWYVTKNIELYSMGNKKAIDIRDLETKYDFVIQERIWTPIGQFSTETVELHKVLKSQNIYCEQVKTLEVTFYNDYWDVLGSFIPFASTKSLLIKGTF